MAYERKKLISTRLDPQILARIDELSKRYEYYSRSYIIERFLDVILSCSDPNVIFRILSVMHPYEKGYTVRFDVDREILQLRTKPNYDD